MLAYIYNEYTKEFRFPLEAQKNPRGDDYFLPAFGTFLQPKECGEHEINVFENEEWVIKKDYRGHYQVDLNNFYFYPVNYIGDTKEGFQFVTKEEYENFIQDPDRYKIIDGKFTDVINTQEYKDIKLLKYKKIKCNQAKLSAKKFLRDETTFELTNNFHVEATKSNMNTMFSYYSALEKGLIESQFWVSKEGTKLELNKEQCLKIFLGIREIQNNIWNNQFYNYKIQIENSKSLEELDKIEIKFQNSES